MQPSIAPAREFENAVETVKNKDNAESKVVPGNEDDTTASTGENRKKKTDVRREIVSVIGLKKSGWNFPLNMMWL
jgi:hypothetical protein